MKINKIIESSQSNGPGKRFTIWVQGCSIRCPNCINPDTWDFDAGEVKTVEQLIEQIKKTDVEGITITGGEPLNQYNEVWALCKKLFNVFNNYTIFLTTGYEYEKIKHEDILNYIDILVSGPYINGLYSDKLLWRGSSNQEIHYLTVRGKEAFEKYKNNIVKAEIFISKKSDNILTTGFSIPEQLVK